jgi:hypothetical protein
LINFLNSFNYDFVKAKLSEFHAFAKESTMPMTLTEFLQLPPFMGETILSEHNKILEKKLKHIKQLNSQK